MKKYLIIVGIVLVVIALMTMYNQRLNNDAANQRTNKATQYTNNIELLIPTTTQPTTETSVDTNNTDISGADGVVLSQDEAVADYNYMWQVLEDNYAFFGVAKRKYGVDKDSVKQKYLDEIMQKGSINIYSFNLIINQCRSEFHGCGELSYTDYASMASSSAAAIIDINNNVSFNIIDGKTAYMKINSMDSHCINTDYEKIINFYSQIKDCENLIIDITGNTGEDINYWLNNIVKQNIDTKTEYDEYFYIKPGKENLESLNIRYGIDGGKLDNLAVPPDKMPDMPGINSDDLKMFDRLYKSALEISPAEDNPNGKKQFNGNIYLLIDNKVTAEADNFAAFCRETGFATIVGTMWGSSGGRGYHHFNLITLPNSGLTFTYGTMYMLNANGSCNEEYGTLPEYICRDGETPLDACLRVIAGK